MNNTITNKNADILLLESIRTGIPSRLMMEKLPDLRIDITKQIDTDLNELANNQTTQGRIIWGEYGQGKTHFLKMIEQYVLQQGFAVSYYTLNRDLGLNNLKTLFPVLTGQTMTGQNCIPGIMNQLTQDTLPSTIMENLSDIEKKICHSFPSYILQSFLSFKDADEMMLLYNSLMGNSTYWTNSKAICRKVLGSDMKNMPKFTIKDHANCFFEFYPYLIKLLGFKGWVILIDEIELIGKLGKVGRLNSYKNLSYLLNWSNEHDLPLYTLAASAKTLQTDVFYSRKNDVQKMPDVAKEKFNAETAFHITKFFDLAAKSNRNLILNPINREAYTESFQTIMDLHKKSINWIKPADPSLIETLINIIKPEQKPIRMCIRMFIELLDIYALSGEIYNNIKEQKVKEYDLNEETQGFTEIPIEEMFKEV